MIKVYFDDRLIEQKYYAGLTRSCTPYDENFKIGNTISESFKLTLDNRAFDNIPNVVKLYEDNNIFATLYIDSYVVNDFTTEFTLVDNMLKFNFPYDAPMINKSDTKTASGESITITDSIDASVPRLRLNGYTKQETTSGKNLVGVKETSDTQNGVTYSYNTDGTFNLSGTATSVCYFTKDINLEDTKFVNGGTYTLSINKQIPTGIVCKIEIMSATSWLREYAISNATSPKTYTVDLTNCTRIRTTIQVNNTSVTNVSNIGFQVEQGTTATSFEQYTGGQPSPSPDYPSEIEVGKGKNLLKIDFTTTTQSGVTITNNNDGSITLNGNSTGAYGMSATTRMPNLKKGTYTLSKNASSSSVQGAFVILYGLTYDGTARTLANTANSQNITITTTEDYKEYWVYIYFQENKSFSNFVVKPMLEKGSEATSYVPYNTIEVKSKGKNLFNPVLNIDGTDIVRNAIQNVTVDNNGEFTFVASGTDMYFGQVASANTNYGARYGYLIKVEPNTTYHLECSNQLFTKNFFTEFNANKVSTGYTNLGSYSKDFTTKSDTKYITLRLGYGSAVSDTTYKTNVMITKGVGITEYQPYQESYMLIDLTKENLFDKNDNFEQTFYNTTTGEKQSSTLWNQTSNINIKNKIITISTDYINTDNSFELSQFDKNDNWVKSEQFFINHKYITKELDDSTYSIKLGFRQDRVNKDKIIIYEGTSPYENFIAQDDYVENGILTNNWGKVVLDGSEQWSKGSYPPSGATQFYTPKFANFGATSISDVILSHFENINKINGSSIGTYFNIFPETSIATTVDEWKVWLSQHPVTVYYKLEEPTKTPVKVTGDLRTYEPTTYIDNDINAEIDLDYKCTQYTSLKEIFTDICLTAGVETTITDFYKSDMRVSWYNNSISAREYLGYIAEINGKNLEIDKDGKLVFKSVNITPSVRIPFQQISDYKIGSSHSITRVVWDDTNNKWEYGTDDGDTYYVNPNNVYCLNQETVEHIYSELHGLTFYNFKTGNCPNSAFKKGELISFTYNNETYNTFSKYDNVSYMGGQWFGGIDLELNTDKQEETQVIDTLQVVRGLKTIVDRDSNRIIQIAESTERNNKIASDIDDDLQSYKQSVTTELSSDKYNVNVLRKEIDRNGVKKVSGSMVTIDEQGLSVYDPSDSTVNTTMTNKEFQIKVNGQEHTFIGYDKNAEQSVARMDNLTITNYFTIGVHRIETYKEDNEERTGHFYIGGIK